MRRMDSLATHILLRLLPAQLPVGTVRGYQLPASYSLASPTTSNTPTYKLSRICILQSHRHQFLGTTLTHALHTWVQHDAARQGHPTANILAHSQIPVKPFYEK
jgi:hypothetical protein